MAILIDTVSMKDSLRDAMVVVVDWTYMRVEGEVKVAKVEVTNVKVCVDFSKTQQYRWSHQQNI